MNRSCVLALTVASTITMACFAAPPVLADSTAPAAKGDPKPFQITVVGNCSSSSCTASFGKKNRVRTINWINCGINTNDGALLSGVVYTEDLNLPVGYMAIIARGQSGKSELAAAEFRNVFEVPSGETLQAQLFTSGSATGSRCTVNGLLK